MLQQPTYDPYSTQSGSAPPSLLSPPPGSTYAAPGTTTTSPYASQPAQPYYGQPGAYPQTAPGFGSQSPPVLYPNGLYGTAPAAAPAAFGSPLKLFQNLQFRDTWVYGKDNDDLQIHDLFLSTTMAFPNFFWSGQPWYVSPGFGLHLWSDPFDPVNPRAALPSKAYSAFLDLGWESDPNNAFGIELAARLGIFSDFETVESDSFRPMGVALLRYNLTPTLALKGGIEYLNRSDIQLLPAGGLEWTPNPKTRWDIYFPQPKLSTYVTTLGTREMWWYVAAEYGGGVWTVTLDDSDSFAPGKQPGRTLMDINDYRVMLGVELNQPGGSGIGRRGVFVEVGYVFEREVLFEEFPLENYTVGETFMLRGGVSF